MVQVAERCPVCGDAMAGHGLWDLVDCLSDVPASAEPLETQLAQLWADLDRLGTLEDAPDEASDHTHRWVRIDATHRTSVEECMSCADWRTSRTQGPVG